MSAFTFVNGETVQEHMHARAQLIYAVSGVMELTAENRQWRVPPQRAIWMPPKVSHRMQAHGAVELRTIYISPDLAARFSNRPLMIAVSPLLRELILRGIEIRESLNGPRLKTQVLSLALDELELLLCESARAPERSLPLPSGNDRRIWRICDAILAEPGHPFGLDEWAHEVGASKRTLARRFQSEFGMSFVNWRQQVRVVAALSRLDQGDPVTVIASDLGYETPAAFSLMFRRLTGLTPSRYSNATGPHVGVRTEVDRPPSLSSRIARPEFGVNIHA
ncbi:AraC family transcriptional regulator [Solirhodobacter olei]|uniref:AraC family transcriptional regulator n=1 Tax=Solirhodobacter olei TaxID=2493082 RepID=UPI000FD712C8|nr:helix-turn-helix transcriptional regulator [Solirhodobacter olei]